MYGAVVLDEPKYFNDNTELIAPVGASMLYALNDGMYALPIIEFYTDKIHFVRVFAGRLTQSSGRTGQTPEDARERLPDLLDELDARGLRCEITCCTDTLERYDEHHHCQEIAQIASTYRETVLGIEVWNEIGHQTQRYISYDELVILKNEIAQHYDGPIALGASSIDELSVETGLYPSAWTGRNAYSTVHLNRNKKPSYREACRIKELYDIRNKHNCGGCNNEPGRFDDPSLDEPDGMGHERFSYLLGLLGSGWSFSSIAHGSQMRDCIVPSGIELNAFNAFLRGTHVIPRDKYTWHNANNTGNWPNSPVKSGAFMEGPANNSDKALWRAYSFTGPRSFVVACGENPEKFNIEYQNGWHPVGMVDEIYKVQVIEISQG